MRCTRPSDSVLCDHGVDLNWLRKHERHSVIWIENYLSAADLDALMQEAHFFLLPSASLHSVSIMQAMAAGAIPVVSDTLGVDRYVVDAVDGIVLKGVFASNWRRDTETGVMIDRYQRNSELDSKLLQQLVMRLSSLLKNPAQYRSIQKAIIAKAGTAFSGNAFSEDFWQKVRHRYLNLPNPLYRSSDPSVTELELGDCLLKQSDWARIFSSPPQPVLRMDVGRGKVVELGGCFMALDGRQMDLHDYSPLAGFVDGGMQPLIFSADMKGLNGTYLGCLIGDSRLRRFVRYIAERLMPYPKLYSMAAVVYKYLRRILRIGRRYITSLIHTADATKTVRDVVHRSGHGR